MKSEFREITNEPDGDLTVSTPNTDHWTELETSLSCRIGQTRSSRRGYFHETKTLSASREMRRLMHTQHSSPNRRLRQSSHDTDV